MDRFRTRVGDVNAGPGLVPPARIPALPVLGGLSKVLWVPPGMQEKCRSRRGASSSSPLRSPLLRLQQSWGSGALGCGRRDGVGAFSIRLPGIFVHPAPGTRGAPDGLSGHS